MQSDPRAIDAQATLAELATRYTAAAQVFQRHGLDFCCRGRQRLGDACRDRHLDAEAVVAELRAELRTKTEEPNWGERPLTELVDWLVDHYHKAHRRELPRLLAMAERVEQRHAARPDCPRGLAQHLGYMAAELEAHMQKEEQVLFPMLGAGQGSHAAGPIQVMEAEHQEHGDNLAQLRRLARDYVPPADACTTWRALMLGLETFERDVMRHIHLENHVLFPRVLNAS